jgi:GGDEF domain-containing protein
LNSEETGEGTAAEEAKGMKIVEARVRGEKGVGRRILNKDLFLYLLDLEVKRGRRYQNFLSILILDLVALPEGNGGTNLETTYQMLTALLKEEMRETDIFGALGEKRLIVLLPYADLLAGDQARLRFETLLEHYDFRSRGYKVQVHQVSFPTNGTDTAELMKKLVVPAPQLSN